MTTVFNGFGAPTALSRSDFINSNRFHVGLFKSLLPEGSARVLVVISDASFSGRSSSIARTSKLITNAEYALGLHFSHLDLHIMLSFQANTDAPAGAAASKPGTLVFCFPRLSHGQKYPKIYLNTDGGSCRFLSIRFIDDMHRIGVLGTGR